MSLLEQLCHWWRGVESSEPLETREAKATHPLEVLRKLHNEALKRFDKYTVAVTVYVSVEESDALYWLSENQPKRHTSIKHAELPGHFVLTFHDDGILYGGYWDLPEPDLTIRLKGRTAS